MQRIGKGWRHIRKASKKTGYVVSMGPNYSAML